MPGHTLFSTSRLLGHGKVQMAAGNAHLAEYFRDVRKDEPAKRFLRGFRTADDALNRAGDANFGEWVNSILRTQPDRRMKELNAIHTLDVERCLKERGYSKFRLHPSEERLLRRYPMGSEARHRFLHALASRSR